MSDVTRKLDAAVGFDGGGSTFCVVLDAEGNVLGQGSAGASNPVRVGIETAFRELAQAAAKTLAHAHFMPPLPRRSPK